LLPTDDSWRLCQTYERSWITRWLDKNDKSPLTNLPLPSKTLKPHSALQEQIQAWLSAQEGFRVILPIEIQLNTLQPYRAYSDASTGELAAAPTWTKASDAQKRSAQLGIGQDKTVYRGFYSGRDVAILYLRNGNCETEASIFSRLGRHPNLISFYGLAHHENKQMIVTELAPMGSLDAVVQVIH